MLKICPRFKKFTTSRVNISTILKVKNTKFSGYCFYMNPNMKGDFQICISVLLNPKILIFANFRD